MIKVLERLKDGDKLQFNTWPALEVVTRRAYMLNDPISAYNAGLMMGQASSVGELRQIDGKNIPEWFGNERLISVWFMLKHPAGQHDDEKLRNVLAVWSIRTYAPDTMKWMETVYVWELGCTHNYDTAGSRPNYGYNKGKCIKCGHTFLCDSGD